MPPTSPGNLPRFRGAAHGTSHPHADPQGLVAVPPAGVSPRRLYSRDAMQRCWSRSHVPERGFSRCHPHTGKSSPLFRGSSLSAPLPWVHIPLSVATARTARGQGGEGVPPLRVPAPPGRSGGSAWFRPWSGTGRAVGTGSATGRDGHGHGPAVSP